MKRLTIARSNKVEQSKSKTGLVPNKNNGSGSKSAGNSTAEGNQPHFTTGVVVSLAADSKETDTEAANSRETRGNQSNEVGQSQQGSYKNQSNSMYSSNVNQSKLLSQIRQLTPGSYTKNATNAILNERAASSRGDYDRVMPLDIREAVMKQEYDEFPEFNSKRPKLSKPAITLTI